MDVLGLVVTKYTHMINVMIDMGHKYIISEKDKLFFAFQEKSEDKCSTTVNKHLTFLIQT